VKVHEAGAMCQAGPRRFNGVEFKPSAAGELAAVDAVTLVRMYHQQARREVEEAPGA